MVVTINIPVSAETRLQQEAERQGVAIPSLIEDIVIERFGSHVLAQAELKTRLEALAVSDRFIPHIAQGREYIYE